MQDAMRLRPGAERVYACGVFKLRTQCDFASRAGRCICAAGDRRSRRRRGGAGNEDAWTAARHAKERRRLPCVRGSASTRSERISHAGGLGAASTGAARERQRDDDSFFAKVKGSVGGGKQATRHSSLPWTGARVWRGGAGVGDWWRDIGGDDDAAA
ncbi:hypothetical protein C8R45DRAFT_998958 [Mycena sanguinolenta]|nr:hypothetical protein C8R45DRAFT_998958 [Mycena sanguinolenta]